MRKFLGRHKHAQRTAGVRFQPAASVDGFSGCGKTRVEHQAHISFSGKHVLCSHASDHRTG